MSRWLMRRAFEGIKNALECIQGAERGLTTLVETVLDDPNLKIAGETEAERRQTLGDVLRKLKQRVRLLTPHPIRSLLAMLRNDQGRGSEIV